jgi:mycothiol synthase
MELSPDWTAAPPTETWVRQLSEACQSADGCRNLDDSLLWAYLDGWADGLWDAGGALLSLDGRNPEGRLQILVHPDQRGQQVGQRLLHLGLQKLRQRGCQSTTLWAYGDHPRSVAWLEREGFQHQRLLFQLRRPPTPTPVPSWPADFRLQPFLRGKDEGAWLTLHQSLQANRSRAWTLQALERQLLQPDTPPQAFHLLWQADNLRGYLWLKGEEIFMFAVDPAVRGQGLGRKLLQMGLSQGATEVYCDDTRPQALALYQSSGFLEVARDRCLSKTL